MRQNLVQTARARQLRQNQTDAEKRLWDVLRARRFLRLKFRRQVPLGPYIVDFYCARHRLVIETDAAPHDPKTTGPRDRWFAGEGFTVLRLRSQDILSNPRGVLSRIAREVSDGQL